MAEGRLFHPGNPEEEDEAPAGTRGEPVVVRHTRDHPFKKRDGKRKGCAHCLGAKAAMQHVGTPQSLNAITAVANAHVYQGMKKHWSARLNELLEEAELPRPLAHVHATGLICFPTSAQRDQGNFRVLIEKALGDVLTAGGWLPDDHWDYYEFGNLRRTYSKGEAWTELTLVPTYPNDTEDE